jgi:acetyltransferase
MINTLDAIFRPRSVAVIGASTREGSLGRATFDNILRFNFNGPLYPIHPKAKYVHSIPAYPSISDVPEPVDLAVIIIPRNGVLSAVEECGKKGVKGLVIISAGFRETGEEGARLELRVRETAKEYGMRFVGPNCMGVINADPNFRLNATFSPTISTRGKIAFASQSGAMGMTILEYAEQLNLGLSMFASLGNKTDISGNDLLEYWRDDPSVEVILMYLESFGNPRNFVKLAKEVSRKKPIIVVKSGRSAIGARAASSHTGAMAGRDEAYDALFHQFGVIRADTIEEMFDISMAFAHQPIPKGPRIAIMSNAGGPAIMAADACDSLQLEIAQFSEETRSRLMDILLPDVAIQNPIDLLAGSTPDHYQKCLNLILKDEGVDGVIALFAPPVVTDPAHIARAVSEAARHHPKPVLGCFLGTRGIAEVVEELKRFSIPTYAFPESAAKAFAAMVRYKSWKVRDKEIESKPELVIEDVDKEKVRGILDKCIEEKRDQLLLTEAMEVLRAYGIPFVASNIVSSISEALDAAEEIGYPAVLKVSSPEMIHKTEMGGVAVDLRDEAELVRAFRRMEGELKTSSFLIQQMVSGGRETIIGFSAVPQFGSLLLFGLGGIYTETLKDVALRIAPLTERDATDLISSIRGYPLLKGVRGEKPIDFDRLKDIILRFSQLAMDFPEIAEAEVNPFLAFPEGKACVSVDGRMRIDLEKPDPTTQTGLPRIARK